MTKEQLLDAVLGIIECGKAHCFEDHAEIVRIIGTQEGVSRETIDEVIEEVEDIAPSPRYFED